MRAKRSLGFTLIELVIGIVVLSLAFSILFNTILPATEQGARQIHQIRAAELGQATMSEIMGKAFDENSNMMGGLFRCGEDQDNDGNVKGTEACTTTLGVDGTEGTDRHLYDDVDDYNGLLTSDIRNSLNGDMNDIYNGFTVAVKVCHDSNYDGDCDTTVNIAKLITVTVTTAEGAEIVFSSYKANF